MKTGIRFPSRTLFTIALGTLVLAAPLSGFGGQDIDETREMPADGLVLVENVAGQVEFVTWDRAEVQVRGEAGDSVEKVEITANSKGVQVRVRNRKGVRRMDGTNLYLRIPESASIETDSVSADVSVSGSRGESILINTVSGDLEIDARLQRLELKSVSGDVEFEGVSPRSSVETVSGEIALVGISGEISVSTVSGDVSVDAGETSRGRFETVSGDLTLALSLADGGRLSCDSMSGDVELQIPASQQAEFTAQSYSGGIRTDFGDSVRVSKGPGEMLQHRVGDNGAQLRLESFSGDISIRRK